MECETYASKEESKILAEPILKELFYRIAVGQNSNFLHKMFLDNNNEAKDLIAKHHYQVVDAAYEMGYDSASQFSKDFKIYFGYPPKDVKPSFGEENSID